MHRGVGYLYEWPRVPVVGRFSFGLALAALLTLPLARVEAVIIIGTSAGNTSAPADAGLATRWSQVGNFSVYMGTPIAPQFFVTAKHVGDLTGQAITFPDATSYTTTAVFNDPNSDLAIYQISGTFPNDKIVPRYSGGLTASGQPITIFGRGVPRSDTTVTGSSVGSGTSAKGWTWGTATYARSWGTNTLDQRVGSSVGVLLSYDFDLGGGTNEGALSDGDSGGPVFISQSGEWRLVGINYGAEAIFSETGSGSGFYAAIYDKGGLYSSSQTMNGPWTYVTPSGTNKPAINYSSSIPDNSTWINSVISVPEPWTLGVVGVACLPLVARMTRRRPAPNHREDPAA